MLCSLLVIAVLLGASPGAQTPAELVTQLGADSFEDRVAAQSALLDLGTAALPAVEAGVRSSEPEIRFRCSSLIPQLRRKQLLDRLAAVRSGGEDTELPLLGLYRARFGADRVAFELFAATVAANLDLVLQVDKALARGDQAAIAELLNKQVVELRLATDRATGPQAVDFSALGEDYPDRLTGAILFAALTKVEVDDTAWQNLGNLLFNNLATRERIKAPDARGALLRNFLEQWCLTARTEPALRQALQMLLYFEGRGAAAVVARRALDPKINRSSQLTGTAADALGRFGSLNDDLTSLLPLLDNQSEFQTGSAVSQSIEVGDVAVLALVRLTGQNPQDYRIRELARFDSDDDRQASQLKLRQWLVENRGVRRESLFPQAPSKPEEFLLRAKLDVEQRVIIGRRFSLLTAQASPTNELAVVLQQGRIQLPPGLFPDMGPNPGSLGKQFESALGRTFLLAKFQNGSTYEVTIQSLDTSNPESVIDTRLSCTSPQDFKCERTETTGLTRTDVEYRQSGDAVTVTVKRVSLADGKLLFDAKATAKDLIELNKSFPDVFAAGPRSILTQLKLALPRNE